MFFGKKDEPKKPQAPIRVTILTDEYIIDAFDDPELSILQASYDSEIEDPSGGTIIVRDARVRSLGQLNTQDRTFAQWRIPSLVKVVAIVSDDPAAEDLIIDGWMDYEHEFTVTAYVGAFTIEGKMYSEDQDPPAFEIRSFAPVADVTITYQLGKKPEIIRGRWGVVNSVLMHGFSAEG